MENESIKVDCWTIDPIFDTQTGKLAELELSFETGYIKICEIRVPNQEDRIVLTDDGVGLCLKSIRSAEEKYGSWLEISSSRTDLYKVIKEWLSR